MTHTSIILGPGIDTGGLVPVREPAPVPVSDRTGLDCYREDMEYLKRSGTFDMLCGDPVLYSLPCPFTGHPSP